MAFLNKFKLRACRKDVVYQAVMHDIVALGLASREDVERQMEFRLSAPELDASAATAHEPVAGMRVPSQRPAYEPDVTSSEVE